MKLKFSLTGTMPIVASFLLSIFSGCTDLDSSRQSHSSSYQESHSAYERDLEERRKREAEWRAKLGSEIAEQLSTYSPDYIKRVVEVLGISQKALQSPRLLIGSVHAEASSLYDKLRLDFQPQNSSAADRGLYSLIFSVGMLAKLESEYYNTRVESNIADRLRADISAMRAVLVP